jgi:hypothetical protein
MGANHGSDVPVTRKLLDSGNVIARIKEMSGERMPKRVTVCWFGNSGLAHGILHISLNDGFV